MNRTIAILATLLCLGCAALTQQVSAATTNTSPIAYLYCLSGTTWAPCSPTNWPGGTGGSSPAPITNYALEANGNLAAILKAIQSPVPTTAPTNCSGTITVAGTAQSIIPAGPVHGFSIQDEAVDMLAFSWTTATPAVNGSGSWTLSGATVYTVGGTYDSPLGLGITTAVYIVGATKGDAFTCAWW